MQSNSPLLAAFFAASTAFAQTQPNSVEVQFTQVSPGALSLSINTLVNRSQKFQKESGRAWSDDGVPLFSMAENSTRDVFRFDQLSLRTRSVQKGSSAGDLLFAVWDFAAQHRTGSVFLIDSPIVSNYSISITGLSATQPATPQKRAGADAVHPTRPGTIAAASVARDVPQKIGEFLTALLNWDIVPEKKPCRLEIKVEPSGVAFFDKVVLGSSTDAHLMHVSGARKGDTWYLRLTLGKGLLRRHYQEVAFVPERIPPLAEAVKTWSQSRLIEQLGSRETTPRTFILFRELAGRDESDATLMELLLRSKYLDWELDQRFRQILQILNSIDRSHARSRRFAEASLREFERIGLVADEAAGKAFPGRCEDPRYEQWAARMIVSGSLLRAPLRYLTSCGMSVETEAILGRVDLPGSLRSSQIEALEAIRERIRRATDKPNR